LAHKMQQPTLNKNISPSSKTEVKSGRFSGKKFISKRISTKQGIVGYFILREEGK